MAVQGCCHGELDGIYHEILSKSDAISQPRPDLLLICGDFQAVRNEEDLQSMAVPDKYKKIGDFQDYFLGKKKAPVLTIFVGGNHEASNHLRELPYGGFVAPNIYYIGDSGVVWFKGLRICGISGIWKSFDFLKPKCEQLPYNKDDLRSVYHVRFQDYLKMSLLKEAKGAIAVSHDWPQGIENYGNVSRLLRFKPFFKNDIKTGKLGSPVNRELLRRLKVSFWFSAHLHTKFEAVVDHREKRKREGSLGGKNGEEIDLDFSEEDSEAEGGAPEEPLSLETRFLALDKCLPKRKFMELVTLPVTSTSHPSFASEEIFLDREIIAITRVLKKGFEIPKSVSGGLNIPPLQLKEVMEKVDLELEKLSTHEEDFIVSESVFTHEVAQSSQNSQNPFTLNFQNRWL